jgi:hypothetical protein
VGAEFGNEEGDEERGTWLARTQDGVLDLDGGDREAADVVHEARVHA